MPVLRPTLDDLQRNRDREWPWQGPPRPPKFAGTPGLVDVEQLLQFLDTIEEPTVARAALDKSD